jgi:hypothetical protein
MGCRYGAILLLKPDAVRHSFDADKNKKALRMAGLFFASKNL